MRVFFAIVAVTNFGSTNADYKRLPMCQKLDHLPNSAYPIEESDREIENCKPFNAVSHCQFGLSDNSSSIIYTIGNGRILYKKFKYIWNDPKPFNILANDSINTIRIKLKKYNITQIKDFRKTKKYIKTGPIYCKDYFYNIYIRYNNNLISSISWEVPGSDADTDD